jgi:hypothetical protein
MKGLSTLAGFLYFRFEAFQGLAQGGFLTEQHWQGFAADA